MNSLAWKRKIGRCMSFLPASQKRDVILLYHSIAGGKFSVSESEFAKQMAWLNKNARVVSLSEMLASQNSGGLRIALSFDDGYETLIRVAHPIMSQYEYPAIVYLNSGLLGESSNPRSNPDLGHCPGERFLSWDQVKLLTQEGWIAGGHGIDHVDLTRTDSAETDRQLSGCKTQIAERLGLPCEHFAYTWGRFNKKLQQAVANAGFSTAVSGLHGSVKGSSDHFALPRVDIRATYELNDFVAAVVGQWDYLGLKQRVQRVVSNPS